MAVAGRVDDEGRGLFAGLLDPVDQFALMVGLAEHDLRSSGGGFAAGLDVGQGLATIDLGFPDSQQVEIGTVQDVKDGCVGHFARESGGPIRIGQAF